MSMKKRITPAYLLYGTRNVVRRMFERVPFLRKPAVLFNERKFGRLCFSQFGEDVVLWNLFGATDGFYVDIGAYDPFQYSNTAMFYKAGWSGVNVDASLLSIERLKRFRPRDTNIHAAISDVEQEVEFEMYDAGVFSRIDSAASPKPLVDGTKPFTTVRMRTRRLAELLGDLRIERPIDFLSVDCEGHDLQVLRSNDWDRFRPKAVVVEDFTRDDSSPIMTYLATLGYRHLCMTGVSRIFIDEGAFRDHPGPKAAL